MLPTKGKKEKLIHLAKKMLPTTQTEALGEAKVTFLLKNLICIDYF